MAEVTEIVPPYSVVPDPNNSATFNADGAVWLGEMNSRINSTNTQGSQMNAVKDEINIKATQVSSDTLEVASNTAEVATNTAKALTYAERAESAVPIGDSYNMDTVDLKDSNVLNASLPNSGYTKVSKKLDNFVFKEDVNFTYKIADKNKYIKFGDVVVDTHTHISYDQSEGGVVVGFINTAPDVAEIITDGNNSTSVAVTKGEYVLDGTGELVEDSTFDTTIGNFVSFGGTVAWDASNGGSMLATSVGNYYAGQLTLSVVVGEQYVISWEIIDGTTSGRMRAGTPSSGISYLNRVGTGSFSEIITTTDSVLYIYPSTGAATGTVYYDSISVKRVQVTKQATRDTADMLDVDDTETSYNYVSNETVLKCTGNNASGVADHFYLRTGSSVAGNPSNTNLGIATDWEDLGTASAMSLNNPYFRDRTDYGVKNQVIATEKNLTKEDDGITPLQNGYLGIGTEILFTDFSKDSTIEEVLLGNGFIKIKPFLYSKDGFLHTPVERRQMNQNQYMYHPFLNPFGTKKANDNNFWYNTSVSFSTVADCFDANKLLANSGNIASGVTGNPRNRFYNVMYKEDGIDSRQYSKLANKIDIDLLRKDKLANAVDEYFSSISSGSFFDVELLGDSTYYPQILKDRIASGITTQVLLNTVDDNGNSNIPDGIKTSFKMNKKMIQNYEVLKSTDSGTTWAKLTSGFTVDLIANTINFTVAPLATDIILISNEASNNPMYLADITDFEIIEEDSFVYASNNNDVSNNIVKLINNVTGKISVGTDSVEQLAITKIMNDLVYQTPKTATVDSTIRLFTAEKDGILYVGARFDNGDTASIDLTDTDVYVMPLNIGRN